MSSDPLGFMDGGNLFIYVRNHPNNSADAFGLHDWWYPCNGRVKVQNHDKTTQIIRVIDQDNEVLINLSPGESTPMFQDYDFVEINGVWYKIGARNYKVKFGASGNPIPCGGFEKVDEKDKGWIDKFLKTIEQNKGGP